MLQIAVKSSIISCSLITCHLSFFCLSENHIAFLIEQLEQLKDFQQRGIEGPSLFNESNLDAAFGMLDPTNQNYITFAQYKHGEFKTWSLQSTLTYLLPDKAKLIITNKDYFSEY